MLAISSTGAGYDMIDVDACTAAGVIVVNQSGTNWEAGGRACARHDPVAVEEDRTVRSGR